MFNLNEKVLVVNIANDSRIFGIMKICTIKEITSKGLFKLNNGLKFTEDGLPYGFRSYKKRCLREPGEERYYGWRMFKISESAGIEVENIFNKAIEMFNLEWKKKTSKTKKLRGN